MPTNETTVTASRMSPAVTVVDVTAGTTTDWRQDFFLCSDLHIDSPHFRRDLFDAHMAEARNRNAKVLIFGDVVDAMQGRKDKRAAKAELLSDLLADPDDPRLTYFDLLPRYVANVLEPHADLILFMSEGNHETAIAKHNEVNVLDHIVASLNERRGLSIVRAGYGGWLFFRMKRVGRSAEQRRVTLAYNHGWGGGAPVTHGVIQANRQQTWLDADVIVNGHNHRQWHLIAKRETLATNGELVYRVQNVVRCPGYKDEFGGSRSGGYAIDGGASPVPFGGWWMRVTWPRKELPRLHFTAEAS